MLEVKVPRGEFTRLTDEEEGFVGQGRWLLITTSWLIGYLEDWKLDMAALTEGKKLQREDMIYDALSEAALVNRQAE